MQPSVINSDAFNTALKDLIGSEPNNQEYRMFILKNVIARASEQSERDPMLCLSDIKRDRDAYLNSVKPCATAGCKTVVYTVINNMCVRHRPKVHKPRKAPPKQIKPKCAYIITKGRNRGNVCRMFAAKDSKFCKRHNDAPPLPVPNADEKDAQSDDAHDEKADIKVDQTDAQSDDAQNDAQSDANDQKDGQKDGGELATIPEDDEEVEIEELDEETQNLLKEQGLMDDAQSDAEKPDWQSVMDAPLPPLPPPPQPEPEPEPEVPEVKTPEVKTCSYRKNGVVCSNKASSRSDYKLCRIHYNNQRRASMM